MKERLAAALSESWLQETAVYLLGNVPGMPPIVQSFHILGIATVVGTIVMIDLRFLGIAVPSQGLSEMIGRLMPWTWGALGVNVLTGLVFVVARPNRYFYNPVFEIKMWMLTPAVLLAGVVYALARARPGFWEQSPGRLWAGRVVALASLVLWVGVILAGRWIAYSDYLFFAG